MGPGMKQRAAGTGRSLSNFLVALAAAWILNENASFSKQVHGQQGIDRIADLEDQRSGSNCTTSLAVFGLAACRFLRALSVSSPCSL